MGGIQTKTTGQQCYICCPSAAGYRYAAFKDPSGCWQAPSSFAASGVQRFQSKAFGDFYSATLLELVQMRC
eukprot:g20622.t1